MKAKRNKTIDISVDDGKEYFDKCITVNKKVDNLDEIINKTIYGNTLEVCKHLPSKFVDLLIVDPPYNLDKNFNGFNFKQMSNNDYANYTEQWIQSLLHTLKDNASIYVCCDWKSSMIIANVLQKYFHIQNRITWQRNKGRGSQNNWKNGLEDIWFVTKGKQYVFNVDNIKTRKRVIAPYKENGIAKDWQETEYGKFRDTHPSNFWDDISIPYWSMAENTTHPTQKPEKLIAKLILASSNVGDVVFDPFLGSGTTSVTAKKLQRNYVGIEMNQQYCVFTEKRLEMANVDKYIQGYEGGIFWERNIPMNKRKKEIFLNGNKKTTVTTK